jgi:hypothetical protein
MDRSVGVLPQAITIDTVEPRPVSVPSQHITDNVKSAVGSGSVGDDDVIVKIPAIEYVDIQRSPLTEKRNNQQPQQHQQQRQQQLMESDNNSRLSNETFEQHRTYSALGDDVTKQSLIEQRENSSDVGHLEDVGQTDYKLVDSEHYHSDVDYNTAVGRSDDYYKVNNNNNDDDNYYVSDDNNKTQANINMLVSDEDGGKTNWKSVVALEEVQQKDVEGYNDFSTEKLPSIISRSHDIDDVRSLRSVSVQKWMEGHNEFGTFVVYTWLAIASASVVILLILARYRHEVSTAVQYVRTGYSHSTWHRHTAEESNDLLSNAQV